MFLKDIDDEVKMVGPTWFIHSYDKWLQEGLKIPRGKNTHIQTYCFGVDREALNLLLEYNMFNSIGKNKTEIIEYNEIGCSQLLLNNGYKLKPFQLSQFSTDEHIDINYNDAYFGTTINPLEIMFIKTNRINNQTVKNYTDWTLKKFA